MMAYVTKLLRKATALKAEMMFGVTPKQFDAPEVHPLAVQHLLLAASSLEATVVHLTIASLYLPSRRRNPRGRTK